MAWLEPQPCLRLWATRLWFLLHEMESGSARQSSGPQGAWQQWDEA